MELHHCWMRNQWSNNWISWINPVLKRFFKRCFTLLLGGTGNSYTVVRLVPPISDSSHSVVENIRICSTGVEVIYLFQFSVLHQVRVGAWKVRTPPLTSITTRFIWFILFFARLRACEISNCILVFSRLFHLIKWIPTHSHHHSCMIIQSIQYCTIVTNRVPIIIIFKVCSRNKARKNEPVVSQSQVRSTRGARKHISKW